MKKPTSFRLAQETLEMLDKLVERENEFVRSVGVHGVSFSRADIVHLLILFTYRATQRGYSLRDIFLLPDDRDDRDDFRGVKGIVE